MYQLKYSAVRYSTWVTTISQNYFLSCR